MDRVGEGSLIPDYLLQIIHIWFLKNSQTTFYSAVKLLISSKLLIYSSERKETNTKWHIWYNSIYMKFYNRQN